MTEPDRRSPLRVVQVVSSLEIRGGAERMATDLAGQLAIRGHESHVISLYTPTQGPSLLAALDESGVVVHSLGKRRGPSVKVLRANRALVAEIDPDVLHTHLAGLRYSLAVSSLPFGRVVHTLHNHPAMETPRTARPLNALAFRRGAIPVLLSNRFRISFEDLYGSDHDVHVIPYGAMHRGGALRYQANSAGITLLAVGRLEPQKRHDVLIDAFSRLPDPLRRTTRLVIVGDGPLRNQLSDQVGAYGLSGSIEFVGSTPEVGAFYRQADGFVLTSDYEGMPLVLIEAMQHGLPIVATDVGAIPDMVEDGVTGLVVPPNDPDAISEAMRTMLVNPELRRDMGRASLARAPRYSLDSMVDSYEELYRTVVSQSAGQRTAG